MTHVRVSFFFFPVKLVKGTISLSMRAQIAIYGALNLRLGSMSLFGGVARAEIVGVSPRLDVGLHVYTQCVCTEIRAQTRNVVGSARKDKCGFGSKGASEPIFLVVTLHMT